jgi:hypothetical protein
MASLVFIPTGGSGWTNSNNIISEDSSYASASVSSIAKTSSTLLSTLNLSALPDSATINGLQVDVKGYVSATGGVSGQFNFSSGISITKSLSPLSTSNSWITLGGASDLWGQTSITPSQLKSASAQWGLTFSYGGVSSSVPLYCDTIKVTVYYIDNTQNTYTMMMGFSM